MVMGAGDEAQINQRDLTLHRLESLDNEITRYRDYEWKIASFFNAFFAAVFLVFIDADRRKAVEFAKGWIVAAVLILAALTAFHMIFVHRKLNQRRYDRHRVYATIGRDDPLGDWSPKFCDLWEGLPAAFIFFSLVSVVLGLAGLDIYIIVHGAAAVACGHGGP